MKIQSTRFGEIECDEADLIAFPEGVLGFPEDSRYVLLDPDGGASPFKWLQSATSPELAFVVIDAAFLKADYRISLD